MILLTTILLAIFTTAFVSDASFYTTNGMTTLSIQSDTNRVLVAAVGDFMCHDTQLAAARQPDGTYNFEQFYKEITPLITKADMALGNLETVLAGNKQRFTGYPAFNSPDEYAHAIKNAGFDVLTTANNHSFDRGYIGVKRTLEILDSLHIPYTGTTPSLTERSKPLVVRVKNINIGIIAYTYGLNDGPLSGKYATTVNVIDTNNIKQDLAYFQTLPIAQRPDKIFAALHWGQEYQLKPTAEQKKIAAWLFQAGVDVLWGSHPHVVQTVEHKTVVRTRADGTKDTARCAAIYSMGNFISAQRTKPRDAGVIVWLSLAKTGEKTTIETMMFTPTYVHRVRTTTRWEYTIYPVFDPKLQPPSAKLPASVISRMTEVFQDISAQFATPDKAFTPFQR